MNVLLAEANVPYEELVDLDDINPQFPQANVALVVGANDVTNPAARKPGTPVSGMPILERRQGPECGGHEAAVAVPVMPVSRTNCTSKTTRRCCSATPRQACRPLSRQSRSSSTNS